LNKFKGAKDTTRTIEPRLKKAKKAAKVAGRMVASPGLQWLIKNLYRKGAGRRKIP